MCVKSAAEFGEEDAVMGTKGIFEQMREDHRRVLDEIAVLDAAASTGHSGRRWREWPEKAVEDVLAMLARQFETHMAAEDEVLFPALGEALPQSRPSIEPLSADHATLRTMLATIMQTLKEPAAQERNEQLVVQLRDLVDLLRIHIRKEEAVVISVAEQVLRPHEVEALAARMRVLAPNTAPSDRGAGRTKGARS
jgi:hemerythrin-like domain-containing protein